MFNCHFLSILNGLENKEKHLLGEHFLASNCAFEPLCGSLSVWPVQVRKKMKAGNNEEK